MTSSPSILVLGSSGWLGSYLVPHLEKNMPDVRLIAAFNLNRPTFGKSVEVVQCSAINGSQSLRELRPTTIVNLSRGEEQIDFEFHQQLIAHANRIDARYIYASSSNAVDGDVSRAHVETDAPFAQTEYGKFKAKCEIALMKNCHRPLAFRFAATHGWAGNRVARTEAFLQKLADGEVVSIPQQVTQNRSFIGDLIEQIGLLIKDEKAEGVFHLGTSDASDELDFLRRLAVAFGYDSAQVVAGPIVNCNVTVVPERLMTMFPSYQLPSEADTIRKVRAQASLAKYIKRA